MRFIAFSLEINKFQQNLLKFQLGYRSSGKTLTEEEFCKMKEELALSQGFGMKNLTKSRDDEADGRDEETSGNSTNANNTKSGLSKLVCDRYPNIVSGRMARYLPRMLTFLIFLSFP